MNKCFIKKVVCFSAVSLLPQIAIGASSNAPTSKNIEIRKLQERITILEYKQKEEVKNQPINPALVLPQVNYRPKYNTAPVYNQDLAMLKMHKDYDKQIEKRDITEIPYPHVEIGGSIIGVGSYSVPPNAPPINGRKQTDLNLAGANFDINAEILSMLLGNMRISYDPNPPEKISRDTIMSRLNNSNIFLNTAFLTLGDLNKSPFYLSGGQMFVPFGEYDSSLLTASLPARLGRTKQRPIAIGFEPHFIPGFNASAFVFKGDAYVQKSSGVINNGGGNVSYTLTLPFLSLTTAGSYIVNIADSGGMQNTGPSTIVSDAGSQVDNSFLDEEDLAEDDIVTVNSFRGFGAQGFGKNTGESLVHRVPAYDLRAKLKLTHIPISFTGELINPTRSFDAANVSFNSNYDPDTDELQPASPSAWHVESGINFTAFNNPSSFIIGYGHSSDALTFNLPRATKGITVRTTFKKAVSVSIGYQVDTAYPAGSYGTGQGITTKSDNFVGTFSKTLSGQINAKF